MTNLYDLLRNTITAELKTKSDEARDQLEYARGAIVEAIVHETRHTDIGGELPEWERELPDNDAPMWEGLCNLGDVGKVTSCRESQCPECRDDATDDS